MKTLNQHIVKITMVLLVGLLTQSIIAQSKLEIEAIVNYLDPVFINSNQNDFKKLVSNIVLDDDFKYRKALKKSKISGNQYIYRGEQISETKILKHFKRAARKSASVNEFTSYFYDRNLPFLTSVDINAIVSLYNVIRQSTFNGYLDEFESVVGTNY